MAIQSPPIKEQSLLDAIQHDIVQQSEAVVATQTHPSSYTRHEDLLEDTALIEDEAAPPAYGEIYGEIRDEKSGFGAQVTDDGRVNIRINPLHCRLSQIFTPALRHQTQNLQETHPIPLPYVPSELSGENGTLPLPLNVVIQVVGSRGDVQPFVALGKGLKETYGHRVRLATHPVFKTFVEENGLEFFSIGGDPVQLMAFMVLN